MKGAWRFGLNRSHRLYVYLYMLTQVSAVPKWLLIWVHNFVNVYYKSVASSASVHYILWMIETYDISNFVSP